MISFTIFYLLALFTDYYSARGMGRAVSEYKNGGIVVLFTACFAYGGFRTIAFHPALQPRYRQWLRLTPWTSSRPLPLGPIHLVWQDGVFLLPVALLAALLHATNPLALVPYFLGGYLICLACLLAMTQTELFAYALGFGLGLVIRLIPYPVACASALILLYPIAYIGIRQSLRRFPWELDWLDRAGRQLQSSSSGTTASGTGPLGWPFERLQPKFTEVTISWRHVFLLSLLLGWWLHALAALLRFHSVQVRKLVESGESAIEVLSFFSSFGITLLVAIRIALYCSGYMPPISLWGRLWTLRWIIPGYDKVFLAPLACGVVAWVGPLLLEGWGLELWYGMPISIGLALFIGLGGGPSLKSWRLTGQYRLTAPILGQGVIKVG
jgi:hypothetical protein